MPWSVFVGFCDKCDAECHSLLYLENPQKPHNSEPKKMKRKSLAYYIIGTSSWWPPPSPTDNGRFGHFPPMRYFRFQWSWALTSYCRVPPLKHSHKQEKSGGFVRFHVLPNLWHRTTCHQSLCLGMNLLGFVTSVRGSPFHSICGKPTKIP